MSAASAVAAGRVAAESLMVDSCTVTTDGVPVWNEATGQYDVAAGSVVYSGKCRVQVPNVAENEADAGERAWTVQDALIMLPVSGSTAVLVGHHVVIDSCALDAQLVGKAYTVTAAHHKTHATARRLRCKEVTS